VAGDIEKNVEVHASVTGFDEAAAEVEHLEGSLEGLTAAEEEAGAAGAEAGAEIAGGMDAAAASAAAAKKEIAGVRDASAESAAAAAAEAAATSGLAAARKEAAASSDAMKKALERHRDASGHLRYKDKWISEQNLRGVLQNQPGGPEGKRTPDDVKREMEELQKAIRSANIEAGGASVKGHGALDEYAANLEKLKADLSEAEPRIDAMNSAIGGSAEKASIASTALGNWHGALRDFGSGHGDAATAKRAAEELDGVIGDFGRTTEGAVRGLGDLSGGLEGSEGRSARSAGRRSPRPCLPP